MCSTIEASKSDLLHFLIQAKKETYAAQGDDATVTPLLEGSRQLEYRAGDYLYRDIYYGMAYFVGQETVYYKNIPLWSMAYSGGVDKQYGIDKVREIYAFLRQAMREVSYENPYRGPLEFKVDDFEYFDFNKGAIEEFSGHEKIVLKGKQVYYLNYSGGYIR
jgi:hypothetical protein